MDWIGECGASYNNDTIIIIINDANLIGHDDNRCKAETIVCIYLMMELCQCRQFICSWCLLN